MPTLNVNNPRWAGIIGRALGLKGRAPSDISNIASGTFNLADLEHVAYQSAMFGVSGISATGDATHGAGIYLENNLPAGSPMVVAIDLLVAAPSATADLLSAKSYTRQIAPDVITGAGTNNSWRDNNPAAKYGGPPVNLLSYTTQANGSSFNCGTYKGAATGVGSALISAPGGLIVLRGGENYGVQSTTVATALTVIFYYRVLFLPDVG